MKITKKDANFVLRRIAGEAMLVPTGSAVAEHNGLFMLTETGAFLWEHLQDAEDETELIARLTDNYDVGEEEAAKDVRRFLTKLADMNIIKIRE